MCNASYCNVSLVSVVGRTHIKFETEETKKKKQINCKSIINFAFPCTHTQYANGNRLSAGVSLGTV